MFNYGFFNMNTKYLLSIYLFFSFLSCGWACVECKDLSADEFRSLYLAPQMHYLLDETTLWTERKKIAESFTDTKENREAMLQPLGRKTIGDELTSTEGFEEIRAEVISFIDRVLKHCRFGLNNYCAFSIAINQPSPKKALWEEIMNRLGNELKRQETLEKEDLKKETLEKETLEKETLEKETLEKETLESEAKKSEHPRDLRVCSQKPLDPKNLQSIFDVIKESFTVNTEFVQYMASLDCLAFNFLHYASSGLSKEEALAKIKEVTKSTEPTPRLDNLYTILVEKTFKLSNPEFSQKNDFSWTFESNSYENQAKIIRNSFFTDSPFLVISGTLFPLKEILKSFITAKIKSRQGSSLLPQEADYLENERILTKISNGLQLLKKDCKNYDSLVITLLPFSGWIDQFEKGEIRPHNDLAFKKAREKEAQEYAWRDRRDAKAQATQKKAAEEYRKMLKEQEKEAAERRAALPPPKKKSPKKPKPIGSALESSAGSALESSAPSQEEHPVSSSNPVGTSVASSAAREPLDEPSASTAASTAQVAPELLPQQSVNVWAGFESPLPPPPKDAFLSTIEDPDLRREIETALEELRPRKKKGPAAAAVAEAEAHAPRKIIVKKSQYTHFERFFTETKLNFRFVTQALKSLGGQLICSGGGSHFSCEFKGIRKKLGVTRPHGQSDNNQMLGPKALASIRDYLKEELGITLDSFEMAGE